MIQDFMVLYRQVMGDYSYLAWKLSPAYQRYQRRAARLNARPRPSKRHGERRGVK